MVPLVLLGIAAVSALSGMAQNKKAAKNAKEASYKQADLYAMQFREDMRRRERGQDRTVGSAYAANYASGVELEGMQQTYITDLKDEFIRENDFMRKSAAMAHRAIRKGANIQYKADNWNATAGAVKGISGAMGTYWGSK